MSHSISASIEVGRYVPTDNLKDLYYALGAEMHNNGWSGDGESEVYSREEIIESIKLLPNESTEERDFLLQLLMYPKVTIRFG